jgi:hypothetical protein
MDESQTPDKTIPHAETDFGNDAFDGTPMKRGRFGGFNEWVFSLMRPKKKVAAIPKSTIQKGPTKPSMLSPDNNEMLFESGTLKKTLERNPISGNALEARWQPNNVVKQKKESVIARLRSKFQFLHTNKLNAVFNGFALVIFAAGTYVLYSEIPGHIGLVVGIIMIIVAGNIIVANR